jgi:hypothetical protein
MSLLINGLFDQSAGGGQVSALCSKNNPRNIKYMPVVISFHRNSKAWFQVSGVRRTNVRADT